MINWIKRKLGITSLESDLSRTTEELRMLKSRVYSLEADNRKLKTIIASENEVNIDFNERGPSRVIFIGTRKGQEVVRSYMVNVDNFNSLLNEFEGRHGYYRLNKVDATPGFVVPLKEMYSARTDYIAEPRKRAAKWN